MNWIVMVALALVVLALATGPFMIMLAWNIVGHDMFGGPVMGWLQGFVVTFVILFVRVAASLKLTFS